MFTFFFQSLLSTKVELVRMHVYVNILQYDIAIRKPTVIAILVCWQVMPSLLLEKE